MALVISQSVSILLKQRTDTRQTSVPVIFHVFKCQSSVLLNCLLPFNSILGPHFASLKLVFPEVTYLNIVGIIFSSWCVIPARKWVIPVSVCLDHRRSEAGIKICDALSMPNPPTLWVYKTLLVGILKAF